MGSAVSFCLAVFGLAWQSASASTPADVGPFVRALWLMQAHGIADNCSPGGDQAAKATLFRALQDRKLAYAEVETLISRERFSKLAGNSDFIDAMDIKKAVDAMIPDSRKQLAAPVAEHLDQLTTTFDMIDEAHSAAASRLAEWVAKNYQSDQELHVIVVCTGNSRRSMLGSCMGNVAAAYYGFDKLRFHSGGTAPSAFNSRTIAALKAIGFEIEPTGQKAASGSEKLDNPMYTVKWGDAGQAVEFSKMYSDAANPQSNFAAIMVCSEADDGCPAVKGATFRLSMPFLDPKLYDGSSLEKSKYAERRDDIGRIMLKALCQARRDLNAKQQ